MAKKRKRIVRKVAAVVEPSISPGLCIGSYGSSAIWADEFGKLWHFDISDGTARLVEIKTDE